MIPPRDTDVTLYSAAGAVVNGSQNNALLTLANSTTYYAELASHDASLISVQWSWAATIAATITYEYTNLPPGDAPTHVAAGRLWDVEITGMDPYAIAGGTAGTTVHTFVNFGGRRLRAKIVVTTGGTAQLRGRVHEKAG